MYIDCTNILIKSVDITSEVPSYLQPFDGVLDLPSYVTGQYCKVGFIHSKIYEVWKYKNYKV